MVFRRGVIPSIIMTTFITDTKKIFNIISSNISVFPIMINTINNMQIRIKIIFNSAYRLSIKIIMNTIKFIIFKILKPLREEIDVRIMCRG